MTCSSTVNLVVSDLFRKHTTNPKTYFSAVTKAGCIPPLVDFSYTVSQEFDVTTKQTILPKFPWKPEQTLPSYPDGFVSQDDILFSRQSTSNSPEIWLMRYSSPKDQQPIPGTSSTSILIYQLNTRSWEQILISDSETDALQSLDRFYASKHGIVYAADLLPSNIVLSKFNEEKKKFELLDTPDPVPSGSTFFDQTRNIFWIFEPNKAIYSFDPVSLQLIKYLETPNLKITFQNGVAFAADGSLYLLNDGGREILQKSDLEILRFDPEESTIDLLIFEKSKSIN